MTPDRSLEQRLAALGRANAVRVARARLKREIGEGSRTALEVLRDPPEFCRSMKALELLMATPGIGHVRATKLLTLAATSQSRTLGGMSERQRAELFVQLQRSLSVRGTDTRRRAAARASAVHAEPR